MAKESFKDDQSEELNTLKNVKKFLTMKLNQTQLNLESLQKEIVVLNDLLQSEKKQNKELQEKYQNYEEIKESNKEIVKELNLKYVNIVGVWV